MTRSDNQSLNQLTKESLQEALVQLLAEKSLDNISITELSRLAGVSRMAFYRNYDSLTQLLEDYLDSIFAEILKQASPYLENKEWRKFWLALFQYALKIKGSLKILFQADLSVQLLAYLHKTCVPYSPDPLDRYYNAAMVGLASSVLREWVANDFDISPDQLANLCVSFTQGQRLQASHKDFIAAWLDPDESSPPGP